MPELLILPVIVVVALCSRDNVPIKVNAVIRYRSFDPQRAVMQVRGAANARIQLALTTRARYLASTRSTIY